MRRDRYCSNYRYLNKSRKPGAAITTSTQRSYPNWYVNVALPSVTICYYVEQQDLHYIRGKIYGLFSLSDALTAITNVVWMQEPIQIGTTTPIWKAMHRLISSQARRHSIQLHLSQIWFPNQLRYNNNSETRYLLVPIEAQYTILWIGQLQRNMIYYPVASSFRSSTSTVTLDDAARSSGVPM